MKDGTGQRQRAGEDIGSIEPIAVSPKAAGRMGGWGLTKVYYLMNSGELESYWDGRSRRITVASIRGRIARKLVEAHSGKAV